MRVTTPIADTDITIARLHVQDGALVMENAKGDAMPTRAVMGPRDVRMIFKSLLRPSVIWFGLKSLISAPYEDTSSSSVETAGDHPTPNPW